MGRVSADFARIRFYGPNLISQHLFASLRRYSGFLTQGAAAKIAGCLNPIHEGIHVSTDLTNIACVLRGLAQVSRSEPPKKAARVAAQKLGLRFVETEGAFSLRLIKGEGRA
jgi:hypothetical protein